VLGREMAYRKLRVISPTNVKRYILVVLIPQQKLVFLSR
jgi:hypothetical protein